MANFNERTLTDFKGKMTGGGARPNLFEVEITFPTGGGGLLASGPYDDVPEKIKFFARSTTMPSSTVGMVPVAYRGRILKIAGDRTFEDWSINVYNDTDFKIRSVMERWVNALNKTDNTSGYVNPTDYFGTATVRQLGRTPTGWTPNSDARIPVLRTYIMQGVWPTFVQDISLDFGANDQIEEFSVQFQVQYWTAFTGDGREDIK